MRTEIILIILGAGICTYLTRFPMILLSGVKKIPPQIAEWLEYIGPAVLTALIVPAVFLKQGKLDFSPVSNLYILSAVITAVVAYISKSMLISVITGVCTVGLLAFLF